MNYNIYFSRYFQDFQFALDSLKNCTKPNLHFYHRKAQALCGVGNIKEAMTNIELAISQCSESNIVYKPAFLSVKGDIFNAAGQYKEAIAAWKEAAMLAEDDFKNDILTKIKECECHG